MKFPIMLRSTHEKSVFKLLVKEQSLCAEISALRDTVSALKAQLEKADDNDHRDPKTGRYVKESDDQ